MIVYIYDLPCDYHHELNIEVYTLLKDQSLYFDGNFDENMDI